jgi:hypothetical protein
MRILIAAKAVDCNRTSEGICSSKFIRALAAAGHEVCCLVGEEQKSASAPLSGVGVIREMQSFEPQTVWTRAADVLEQVRRVKGLSGLHAKLQNAVAKTTGYYAVNWVEVSRWRAGMEVLLDSFRPDVIVLRAAGLEFEPHLAALSLRTDVPVVANYHDPFPASLYPPPYQEDPVLTRTRRQEVLHRRIIARADVLTFPSRRLRDWVLKGELEGAREKAFVLPHIAGEMPVRERDASPLPAAIRPDGFNLVHTGTLIKKRDPAALIAGFTRFVNREPERRRRSHLFFVGGVHKGIAESDMWRSTLRHPNITCVTTRISYEQAMRLGRHATAAVVLEADGVESPFFPAKLSDYVWLNRPVLAVTPRESAVSDLLGHGYPLVAAPGDAGGVERALETLWARWSVNSCQQLAPPSELRKQLSAESVVEAFEHAAGWALAVKGRDVLPHLDGERACV